MKTKKKSEGLGDGAAAVTVRATLRLPAELWKAAQHQAIDSNIPAAELVARALSEYLKKGGRP